MVVRSAAPVGRSRRPIVSRRAAAWWLVWLAACLAAAPCVSASESASARILVREAGVYQVTHEDLRSAGLDLAGVVPHEMGLSSRGEPVPIWVSCADGDSFEPGCRLEFVATPPTGRDASFGRHNTLDVYWLRFAGGGRRMREERSPEPAAARREWRRRRRFEVDRLMIRLSEKDVRGEEPDLWFWAKLTHADRQPFRAVLELPGLARERRDTTRWRAETRGLSDPESPGDEPQHEISLTLGEDVLGGASWNGKLPQILDLPRPDLLGAGAQTVEIAVPRRLPAGADPLVDVVMLNWIEVDYPHDGQVEPTGVELYLTPGESGTVDLRPPAPGRLVVYGDDGSRTVVTALRDGAGAAVARLATPRRTGSYWVVPESELRRPVAIELDRPSRLSATDRQADYLMIAHSRLIAAVEPLARFHRDRGLEVAVVDVQDVYDEFSEGIVDPAAIKAFISHAYRNWSPPVPRFVLLVGDASWDVKNVEPDDALYANWTDRQLLLEDRFAQREGRFLALPQGLAHRNLIPTRQLYQREGQAASDVWFVDVEGDDLRPELAIGRFPVVDQSEVAAIVGKTIRYATRPAAPDWARRSLLVTNEDPIFQARSDRIGALLEDLGFAVDKLYPQSAERSNEEHGRRLQEYFSGDEALIHFLGHGGRFIWRTGPSDFEKNHDLFTLEHLDGLRPTDRPPIVLSMTCYSGPFDHPNADSIGEKLLRLDGRGAVAVLAASWRTMPFEQISRAIVEELTRQPTLGEALQKAYAGFSQPHFLAIYSLFGDPALPLPFAARDDRPPNPTDPDGKADAR